MYKILIIEDDEIIVQIVKRHLESWGYEVFQVEDFTHVIQEFVQKDPQLVLLDSDFSAMPGIVGEGRRVINNIQRAASLFLVKNIFSLGLSLLSLFTNWPYPLVPVHLSVISSLTIGVPSFFLAMEPNYERVTGRFLPGVLRRAFPGGLTNIFVVLMAQAYGAVFGLPQEQLSAVCAAILSIVGLLVLYQVCKPFDFFRRIIWNAADLSVLTGCITAVIALLHEKL